MGNCNCMRGDDAADDPKYINISTPEPEPKGTETVWIIGKTKPFRDTYQIGEQLGEPDPFDTYRCKRKKDNKIFVVKQIPKNKSKDVQKWISTEIDILRQLKHKHKYIINIEECYENHATLYVVMEHYKGGDLFDRIKSRRRYKESDASSIIKMLLETLFYLHEYHHIIHCDIKPDSILFADETEDSVIKLSNFTMSKVWQEFGSSRDDLCGTPYYTAPEIILGDYSFGCDMWSVGVVMFSMLFGFPPFYVDPNKFHGVEETKEIYTLIMKGFDPNTKKGYGAWFPNSIPMSDESKDLMARLMDKNVSTRLTAKEALQHPWICKNIKREDELIKKNPWICKDIKREDELIKEVLIVGYCKQMLNDTEIIKIIFNFYNKKEIVITKYMVHQFANFARGNKFKHVLTLLFRHKFEQDRAYQFENMKQLFNELNMNGNDMLCENDFTIGMLKSKDIKLKDENIKQMFEELDFRKKGEIEFDNFLKAAIYDYLIATGKKLQKLFFETLYLDDDWKGTIDTGKLKEKIQDLDMYDNANDLFKIIDDVDLYSHGYIDLTDFVNCFPTSNKAPKWFWDAQVEEK